MSGHKASGMGAHYDNRDLQLILDEQAAVFPEGPLATLTPPKVHVEGLLPDNIVRAVLEVLDGKMQPSELVMVLLDERAKRLSKQTILTK